MMKLFNEIATSQTPRNDKDLQALAMTGFVL